KKARVALMNQLRGLLAERGEVCGRGRKPLLDRVQGILDADLVSAELTPCLIERVRELREEWRQLDERIDADERAIQAHAEADTACQLVGDIEGIGPITASAVVALVGDGSDFCSGRQMAAWLGLTPREYSSGDTRRLGG